MSHCSETATLHVSWLRQQVEPASARACRSDGPSARQDTALPESVYSANCPPFRSSTTISADSRSRGLNGKSVTLQTRTAPACKREFLRQLTASGSAAGPASKSPARCSLMSMAWNWETVVGKCENPTAASSLERTTTYPFGKPLTDTGGEGLFTTTTRDQVHVGHV